MSSEVSQDADLAAAVQTGLSLRYTYISEGTSSHFTTQVTGSSKERP